LFCFFSKKTSFDDLTENNYPSVFASESDASNALTNYFIQSANGEQLLRITNIVYLESGNKTYALVYYESNQRTSNILFEKVYQGQDVVSGSHHQCSGTSCDCKVAASIGQNGEVSIGCSCTGCTMTVTDFNP
jgi:hypothetical protein